MISKDKVLALIEEVTSANNMFLVDLRISAANHIAVEVDSLEGVNIKDCLKVSRHIEGNLDREVEDYSLEVSSPGLDKPLRLAQQYIKNIGRSLKVSDLEGREAEGVLTSANEQGFELSITERKKVEGQNRKANFTTIKAFNYTEIKSAYIVISFK